MIFQVRKVVKFEHQHSWLDSGQICVINIEFLRVNRIRLSRPNAASGWSSEKRLYLQA